MMYNGGKAACAKQLAAMFNTYNPATYWEPFVGAGSVISLVKCAKRYGSDIDPHIVALLKAVRDGHKFPSVVTTEMYAEAKRMTPACDDEYAYKAFVGYGCSFAGKWFGGYARSRTSDRNFAAGASSELYKQGAKLCGTKLRCSRYTDSNVAGGDMLIYCDPPYADTTRCGTRGSFDSSSFWDWVRDNKNMVVVTEYRAPDDFVGLWHKEIRDGLTRYKGASNVETLFAHESKVDYFRERAKIAY